MQAYEAWRAVVRCVPFGPGFKVLTAVSHRLGAREGYCGTGGYTCTLARAGFRPGSVLLEASEVQFVHEYKIRLRPDACWAPEASSNTEPKTGPDRCLCISSGPSGMLPMGLAATAHSSLGPQAGPAGCTAESCLAEAGTRVPAHASGQSPSWRRLLCT